MRARLATVGALIALVAATALAAGCGATLDPVAQAATRTSGVSSLRFSISMTLRVPSAATPVTLTAAGAIDSAAHRFEMGLDYSKIAALEGRPGSLGRLDIVEDGLVMYLTGAGLSQALPGGKTWLRVDLSQAAGRLGLDLSGLTGGQTDPRTSLAQLRGAGNVVRMGPATVKGVATTRYNVLVDLEQGLDKLDPASRATMQQLVDRLQATGGRYVPADAWIDGDGYLRRFRISIPDYLGTGSSIAMTMDLFGFGEPVTIALPDPAGVTDITGELSQPPGG